LDALSRSCNAMCPCAMGIDGSSRASGCVGKIALS
jgi:hypothetical protein